MAARSPARQGPSTRTGGWGPRPFRTGDVACHDPEGYRLLGRASVDIIKTGGEKVSALEVEDVFRTHPDVADRAVVGPADPEWGERVAIALVPAAGTDPDPAALRAWGKERLAPAKVPARHLRVAGLPRTTMGKVTKPAVVDLSAPPPAWTARRRSSGRVRPRRARGPGGGAGPGRRPAR